MIRPRLMKSFSNVSREAPGLSWKMGMDQGAAAVGRLGCPSAPINR